MSSTPLEDVIPQRTLRNDVSRVLREVRGGRSFRITVDGQPVAELRPIDSRATWVSSSALGDLLARIQPDPTWAADVAWAVEQRLPSDKS